MNLLTRLLSVIFTVVSSPQMNAQCSNTAQKNAYNQPIFQVSSRVYCVNQDVLIKENISNSSPVTWCKQGKLNNTSSATETAQTGNTIIFLTGQVNFLG